MRKCVLFLTVLTILPIAEAQAKHVTRAGAPASGTAAGAATGAGASGKKAQPRPSCKTKSTGKTTPANCQ